jgi:hypothetical protein
MTGCLVTASNTDTQAVQGFFEQLAAVGALGSVYVWLIVVISLSAVFAPKAQRKAAYRVLKLLLPRRRPPLAGEPSDKPTFHRTASELAVPLPASGDP